MKNFKRNLGYTIDQTILIVAIIAILITLVIATVGWDIITRAGGTKLAAQFRQIEDSVGQFYADHQMWPHQAITQGNNWAAIPRVLANTGAGYTRVGGLAADDLRNYIAGLERNPANNYIYHNFGAGGRVLMVVNEPPAAAGIGSNSYFAIQFANVPVNEATKADEVIDGDINAAEGRVVYNNAGTNCLANGVGGINTAAPGGTAGAESNARVQVCYFANLIQ